MTATASRTHTEQGLERKHQLLEAAARLFSTKGYSNTRIADICAEAGVAKGLMYWYFPTKQSLFAELVRTMRQQLRRTQAAAMDPSADAIHQHRHTDQLARDDLRGLGKIDSCYCRNGHGGILTRPVQGCRFG